MKKILGAVLALGFVFRVLFLGQRQLWTDELMQAVVVRAGSLDELIRNLRDGMALPAPLDFLVQKGVVLLLGASPWSLRLHAAILGTASIWLFYRLGVTLFGRRVALYASALFAFYPLHHHYSQEGRPYSLLVLFTLLSFYLLLRCLSVGGGGRGFWVGLAAACVLMLYTSVLGTAVLLCQLATLILSVAVGSAWSETVTQRLKRVLNGDPEPPPPSRDLPKTRGIQVLAYVAVACIAVGLYTPWLLSSWHAPGVVVRAELARPGVLLVALKGIGDNSWPVTGLLLMGVCTGIQALRAHGRRRCILWLLTWPFVYVVAVWVLDVWCGYFFAARQLVPATPALLLLAGYGMAHVGERLTLLDGFPYRLSSPAQVYVAALLVMSIAVAQARWRKDPADWAGVAQYLQQNLKAGDQLSMPQVSPLLEYLAPSLRDFRSADLDPGAGTPEANGAARRLVVCFNGMAPDPCTGFRPQATRNGSWTRREMPGFTIFARERK